MPGKAELACTRSSHADYSWGSSAEAPDSSKDKLACRFGWQVGNFDLVGGHPAHFAIFAEYDRIAGLLVLDQSLSHGQLDRSFDG